MLPASPGPKTPDVTWGYIGNTHVIICYNILYTFCTPFCYISVNTRECLHRMCVFWLGGFREAKMLKTQLEAGVGPEHDPTIKRCATVYRNDSCGYIINPSELELLKNEPMIRDFANVTPDTYELIKATNPYLLIFVNLAKKIMEAEV